MVRAIVCPNVSLQLEDCGELLAGGEYPIFGDKVTSIGKTSMGR